MTFRRTDGLIVLILWALLLGRSTAHDLPHLELKQGEHIVFVGGAYVEGMKAHGYMESLMMSRFRELNLTFGYEDTTDADLVLHFFHGRDVPQISGLKVDARHALISSLTDSAAADVLAEEAVRLKCAFADLSVGVAFLHENASASRLVEGNTVTDYGYWCMAQLALHYLGLHMEALEPSVRVDDDKMLVEGLKWLPNKPPGDARIHIDFLSRSVLLDGEPCIDGPIYDHAEQLRSLIISRVPGNLAAIRQAAVPRAMYKMVARDL